MTFNFFLIADSLKEGTTAMVWAEDLNGAYRQFPVRDPGGCYCVLMTPQGPVLLQHHAMTFGAVSSV